MTTPLSVSSRAISNGLSKLVPNAEIRDPTQALQSVMLDKEESTLIQPMLEEVGFAIETREVSNGYAAPRKATVALKGPNQFYIVSIPRWVLESSEEGTLAALSWLGSFFEAKTRLYVISSGLPSVEPAPNLIMNRLWKDKYDVTAIFIPWNHLSGYSVKKSAQERLALIKNAFPFEAELIPAPTPANAGSPGRDLVFFSYSHKDREWLDRLQTTLAPLVHAANVKTWSDEDIKPGDNWRQEIASALKRSKVAVLLVTADFLASNFVVENELPTLLDAAKKEGLAILWVPVSFSLYRETAIEPYQAAHPPDRPLESLSKPDLDKALVDICERIKAAG